MWRCRLRLATPVLILTVLRRKEGTLAVDHRLILNTTTKTMYVLDFESPESRWEEAWTKGAKMLEMLSLDENI
jgi:hypothetical protein